MKSIRAFVGHSFDTSDESLIDTFLKFFNSLSDLDFEWDHAESAEAMPVSKKVLSRFEGKTVFIAICTAKEVVAPRDLSRCWLQRSFSKARTSSFSAKTSDWILQEIGLALGLGLDLIVLKEDLVRDCGGLQGDWEYIPFNRAKPEKAFKKIIETISKLKPNAGPVQMTSSETKDEKETEDSDPDGVLDFFDPKPDWDQGAFERSFHLAYKIGNEQAAGKIKEKFQQSHFMENAESVQRWRAFVEFVLLVENKGGNFRNLDQYATNHPKNSSIQELRARALLYFSDHSGAASAFKIAADTSSSILEQLQLLARAAISASKAENTETVNALISEMTKLAHDVAELERPYLEALLEIASAKKDKYVAFAIRERLIELDPSDLDTRFQLAYQYSEAGQNALSLHHYLQIPREARNGTAWNNLGVAYQRFNLHVRSAAALRQAVDLGETLAMSNLANRYLGAGFIEDARSLCKQALEHTNPHQNVSTTLASIEGTHSEESAKIDEVLENCKEPHDFFKMHGRAIASRNSPAVQIDWQAPECLMKFSFDKGTFTAIGEFKKERKGGLGGFLLAWPRTSVETIQLKYQGSVRGRILEGRFSRESDDPYSGGALSFFASPTDIPATMVLDVDGRTMQVMKVPAYGDPTFEIWHAIPQAVIKGPAEQS